MTIEQYSEWIEIHAQWVAALNELKSSELGFSFTECIAPPDVAVRAANKNSYLYKDQEREAIARNAAYSQYRKLYRIYESEFRGYLWIGKEFYRDITDLKLEPEKRRELMIFSESRDHLFHNAAVLWLEHEDAEAAPKGEIGIGGLYEDLLKFLWLAEVWQQSNWSQDEESQRSKAFFEYASGRNRDDFVSGKPVPFDEIYQGSHVTLGKVLMRRRTVFHADDRIRAHPGFWGLFLVSPYNNGDRGFFQPGAHDVATTQWMNLMSNAPYSHGGDTSWFLNKPATGQFQIYEKVPRLFASAAVTPPGVYLHRSKAHGRDDFLALVTGSSEGERQTMMCCTKGVGADPNLIPEVVVGQHSDLKQFKAEFNHGGQGFPIAYPDTAKQAQGGGSWSTVGFCVNMGDEIEVATTDFEHFGTIAESVRRRPPLAGLDGGFVEPFVCIEMSRLSRNVRRLPRNLIEVGFRLKFPATSIAKLPEDAICGFPAQVVTVAPCETSLRFYKKGSSGQNYDYGSPALELWEWERSYRDLCLPDAETLLAAIDRDCDGLCERARTGIMQKLAYDFHRKTVDAFIEEKMKAFEETIEEEKQRFREVGNGHKAWEMHRLALEKRKKLWLAETKTRHLLATTPQETLIEWEKYARTAAPIPLLLSVDRLKRKMKVAMRAFHGAVASYVAFLNLDWATDTYTGSFSGRNYNSGPRDSNEWGAFIRPSSNPQHTAASVGSLCGQVDAHQIADLLTANSADSIFRSLGLTDLDSAAGYNFDPRNEDMDAHLWKGEHVESLLMWRSSTLEIYSSAFAQWIDCAKIKLEELYLHFQKSLEVTPVQGMADVNRRFCAEYRAYLKANLQYLPESLRAVGSKLI